MMFAVCGFEQSGLIEENDFVVVPHMVSMSTANVGHMVRDVSMR